MEEKLNLDLENLSSEPFFDDLVKEITEDPSFLIGIFVAVAVVIITFGKKAFFGPFSNVYKEYTSSQSFSD